MFGVEHNGKRLAALLAGRNHDATFAVLIFCKATVAAVLSVGIGFSFVDGEGVKKACGITYFAPSSDAKP